MYNSRVYLAAPIFTPEQLAVVEVIKGAFESRECDVFSPYHNSRGIWRGRAPRDCSPEERAQVLSDNIKGIEWCDYLFAWVGTNVIDTGVVWEMGYAAALSKAPAVYNQPVRRPMTIAYFDDTDVKPHLNLMLAGTMDAVVQGRKALPHVSVMAANGYQNPIRERYHPDKLIRQEKEPIV